MAFLTHLLALWIGVAVGLVLHSILMAIDDDGRTDDVTDPWPGAFGTRRPAVLGNPRDVA